MGKSISEIWQEVQDKYKVGLEQSLSQGSTVPLTNTMEQTAADIKERYGIDINELLNLSKEDIDKLKYGKVEEKKDSKIDYKKYIKPTVYVASALVLFVVISKIIKK